MTFQPQPRPASPPSAKDFCLRKHVDYQRVYQAARKQFSSSMTFFAALRAGMEPSAASIRLELPRVGLTVGKVIGKAHERNRIKRRLREIIRQHLSELPCDVDLILHPRRSVITMESAKLQSEVLRIFRQVATQMRQPAPTNPVRLVKRASQDTTAV